MSLTSSFSTRAGHAALLALALLIVPGCGDDDAPPGGDDAGMPPIDSGSMDAGPRLPDGARSCTSDEDCVDGVTCTRDVCDPAGYCRNPVDPGVCDDEIFCNGVEQCDPRRGCVPGPRETCNDDDVCTIDRCNEAGKTCEHSPRDLDGDGDPDFFCAGGSDCDDRDPTRHSEYPEVCGDAIDNDCDEQVDESTCGRAPNDVCADPLDVSAGGVFVVDTTGLGSEYTLGCLGAPGSGVRRRDFVLTFTLEEARDVRIEAQGASTVTAIALRTECTTTASELECRNGFPAQVRRRSLEPGTYFAIVSADAATEVVVRVEMSEPTAPPTNETCATAQDIGTGGRITGTTVDVRDDTTTRCGGLLAPELVYSFTLESEQDVRITASSLSEEALTWELRGAACDDASVLRCSSGAPAIGRVHLLEPGTYYIVVEGPSYAEVDFELDVEILEPTAPPEGDLCRNPIPLELGVPTSGTLLDRQDDVSTTCGFNARDVVYSFELEERRDVTIEVGEATTSFNASVRTECGDGATQLRCARGSPVRTRMRDLAAGTYYVVVESFLGTSFTITATDSEPVTPVEVTGNETCETAYDIPETGGLFSGDTTTFLDDLQATCGDQARSADAMFRLVLPARRRVTIDTGGSTYDTVVHLHRDSGTGTCTSRADIACDDDSGDGSASFIDRTLDAGTYFIVVDGRGMVSRGAYTLEVLVSP